MKGRTKKRLIALGLVAALGAGGVAGMRHLRASRLAQRVEEARVRGMDAYEAGEWARAMTDLTYFVSRTGRQDAEALVRLADARQRVPEPDGSHVTIAIRVLLDAAAADPDHPDVPPMLLDLYERAGLWPEALTAIDRALASRGNDRDLMERRVAILAALGRRGEAIGASRALAGAFPSDVSAHRLYIGALLADGERRESQVREHLDTLPGLLGEGTDLWVLRAQTLGALGDAAGALEACSMAVAAGVRTGEQLRLLLGVLDSFTGDRRTARALTGTVVSGVLDLETIPEDMGQMLVARAWCRGELAPVDRALAQALAEPAHAADSSLGWALLAGADLEQSVRRGLALALVERVGVEGTFWRSCLVAVDGLRENDPRVLDRAREAAAAADLLPNWRVVEREVAAFVLASAERGAGATEHAEERLGELASRPGWRLARRGHVQLLLERGAFQEALEAVDPPLDPDPEFKATVAGVLLGCSALVGLGEQSDGRSIDGRRAVRLLESLVPSGVGGTEVLGLLARAHAATGNSIAAAEAVDQMVALGSAIDPATAARTVGALRVREPALADRVLEAAVLAAPGHPAVVYQRALGLTASGRGDEARAALIAAEREASGLEAVEVRRARARLLDETGDPRAREELAALAASHPDNLGAQQEVLWSRAAWTDEALVRGAIARVRAISGESAAAWRLHEARRLLTFGPSPARASEALTPVLEPLLRSGRDARAFELAAQAWMVLENREQAIASLTRAVEGASNRAAVYPRLIALLLLAGRAEEARARLEGFAALGEIGSSAARLRAGLLEHFAMWNHAVLERERLAGYGGPEDVAALADLYARTGRSREARELYDRLLDVAEPDPGVVSAAARFMAATGSPGDGAALFARLEGRVPEGERILMLAEHLRSTGSEDEARRMVRAHAESSPRDAEAWAWLARASFGTNEVDAARGFLRRGLESSPGSPALLAIRRLDESGLGDPRLIAALAAADATQGADPAATELAGAIGSLSRGEVDAPGLARRLEGIAREHPTSVRAWTMLTRLRLGLGDMAGATRSALEAMRMAPGDASAARLATEILIAAGRPEDALGTARAWRERSPGDAIHADAAIAGLLASLGRHDAALATIAPWRRTIIERPTRAHAEALTAATAAAGSVGDRRALLSLAAGHGVWARACIVAAPMIADAAARRDWLAGVESSGALGGTDRLELARLRRGLWEATGSDEDLARALAHLDSSDAAGSPDGVVVRAAVLRDMGRVRESEAAWREAIRLDPGSIAGHAGLAELLITHRPDQSADAVASAREVWTLVGRDAGMTAEQRAIAADLLARGLIRAERWADAAAAADEGLRIAARHPALLARKAEALLGSGDRAGASAALEQITPAESRTAGVLALAARIGPSRPDDAEWLYRNVLDRDRTSYIAMNNLAHHLIAHGRSGTEATDMAERAAFVATARGAGASVLASIHETWGSALLAQGRATEAERAFREGLRHEPGSTELLLGLADALAAQGRRDEASRAIESLGSGAGAGSALTGEQRTRYQRLAEALAP